MFSLRGTTFGHHLSPRKGEAGAVPKITTIRHHQTAGALGLHFGRAQRRPCGVERAYISTSHMDYGVSGDLLTLME